MQQAPYATTLWICAIASSAKLTIMILDFYIGETDSQMNCSFTLRKLDWFLLEIGMLGALQ